MLAALAPTARKALTAALVALDHGARLYPRSRGRRFTRLDDQAAEAYIRALLARGGVAAQLVQRIRGLVVMCYYELPAVQREIGYHPAPYIAAVSRRRLESYGPQIRAGEAAVTRPGAADRQTRTDRAVRTRARDSRDSTDASAGVRRARDSQDGHERETAMTVRTRAETAMRVRTRA